MCAALEQYPPANVYNRSSQSEKKQKQLMQQIIKTMGRMKYVCDHFKIFGDCENRTNTGETQKRYLGRRKFQGPHIFIGIL